MRVVWLSKWSLLPDLKKLLKIGKKGGLKYIEGKIVYAQIDPNNPLDDIEIEEQISFAAQGIVSHTTIYFYED